jgi:hypothetical protein
MVVRTILNGASIPAIKIPAQSVFLFAVPTRRAAARTARMKEKTLDRLSFDHVGKDGAGTVPTNSTVTSRIIETREPLYVDRLESHPGDDGHCY